MRICVIGSCGKKKSTQSEQQPTCKDLQSPEALDTWTKKLADLVIPARDMYTGNQNRELVKGVDKLRTIPGFSVDLFIISAGFGFLSEDELVPPYECSFSLMKRSAIITRSKRLEIPTSFGQICQRTYDLMYLALGKNYLFSLGPSWPSHITCPTVMFDDSYHYRDLIHIPAGNKTVKSFSIKGKKVHGAAGFKGDLLRILAEYALSRDVPYDEVIGWKDPSYFRQLVNDLGGL